MDKLIAIVGPTGSGKSELALILARRLAGEIVSADSRQVYRLLNIGTSKPSQEEQELVRHHFIDILDPAEEYSAGAFGKDARATIAEIKARDKLPILVGGSGLYIKAVIDGFFDGPAKDTETRQQLERRLREEGPEALLQTLQEVDPVTASRVDSTKMRRVIRALEVYTITGRPISELHAEQTDRSPFEMIQIGIAWERIRLYERIEERVDRMIAKGLVDEVTRLKNIGYNRNLNALNSVGYKEVFDFLEGKVSHDEMVGLIKRNTRRFAKRQMTWFRADQRITWVNMRPLRTFEELAGSVLARIRNEPGIGQKEAI